MQLARFFRVLLLVAFLTATLTEEAKIEPDCATPGECENPDTEAVVTKDALVESAVQATVGKGSVTEVELDDPKCPSRPHIIRCAAINLDTNKNNKLERIELETAINALPWYSKGILKILGSIDKIMQKCDFDQDGAIGIDDDMENTKDICLATCFKRRAFKGAFFPDCQL